MRAADQLARARRTLARPGAWIEAEGRDYRIRLGPDRRAGIGPGLDEAGLAALIATPGLRPRPGGGWTLRPAPPLDPEASARPAFPPPGRPGAVDGRREVTDPDGRIVSRSANLGESPLMWLARRRDAAGKPWLNPAQLAAGERLRRDAEAAMAGARLTMRWDDLPRAAPGSTIAAGPSDRVLNAQQRYSLAMTRLPAGVGEVVARVCVLGFGLQAAERDLGLRRPGGRTALIQGLTCLAEHYGLVGPARRPADD